MLYQIYEQMEKRIAPGVLFSQTSYGNCLEERVPLEGRWLELGCGHQLLPSWDIEKERRIVARAKFVVGLDPDRQAIQYHSSIGVRTTGWGDALPFTDASFDIVTMNMVVEHLEHPEVVFREVQRVLRPNGVVVFHTPNLQGYATQVAAMLPEFAKAPLARLLHGRASEDVYPTHYRCNTRRDITECAAKAGLDVVEISFIRSSALTAKVAPIAALELLWLRALASRDREQLRPNIIGVLRRPA